MTPPHHEWQHEEFILTDDPARVDLDAVCELLSGTYWASDRSREVTAEAIRHSVCLSLWRDGRQVGFCRVVTDRATFAWISDVVLHPDWRGRGVGKWMIARLLEHPALQTRTQALATRDAHALYERHGFTRAEFLRRGPPWSPPQP